MAHTQGITEFFRGRLGKPYGPARLSSGSAIAVGHGTTPFVSAYPWVDQVGFGTKFTNPATLPTGIVNGAVFAADAKVIFLAHDTAPFASAYPWSTSGFGTKFANPATPLNGNGSEIAFRRLASSASDHVAIAEAIGPFISVYRFSKSGAGWGTIFSDPATAPVGSASGVDFAPNGVNIAVSHVTTPFLSAYPWSDSGFGAKYANPAVLPFSGVTNTRFSHFGGALSVAHAWSGTANIAAYTFASGFGTKYADPVYAGGFTNPARKFAINNGALMIGLGVSAGFDQTVGFRWNDTDGFGTRYSALPRVPAAIEPLAYNLSKTTCFLGPDTVTARIGARRWTNTSGFGTAYSLPATIPTGTPQTIAIAP